MKTKNNREIKSIIILLTFIVMAVVMAGCTASSNNSAATPTPDVNRNAPANVSATQTPTPDPVAALYGEWETNDPDAKSISGVTTEYVRWKINPGVKDQNGLSTGKVSNPDRSNMDIANYKIGPQNSLNLEFVPPARAASASYEYEVSSDGNTLTLKGGGKPIILKRGTSNRDMLNDAQTMADSGKGDWKVDRDVACKVFPTMCSSSSDTYVRFETPTKYNEGYTGTMLFFDSVPTSPLGTWKYTITAKDKVEFNDGKGTRSGSYKILNDGKILQIDFVNDSDPDLYLTR